MTIRDEVLYHHEGNFKMKAGLKFVESAKGAFGIFPHIHIVKENDKTRCGRKIPDTWNEVELDLAGYFDATMCGPCLHKFSVLEKLERPYML